MKKHTTLRQQKPGTCVLNSLAVMQHKATAVCSAWRTLLVLLIGLLPMTSLQATDSTTIFTPPAFKTSYMAELVQKDINSLTKQEIDTVKSYAIALWQKIKSEKRILKAGQVSADKIQDFPVAVGDISPGTGTVDYAICFDKMVINATGKSILQAYMVFAPPGGGDKAEPMVFMAKDVEITALGGISHAQLSMVGGFTLLKNSRFEVNIIGSQSGVIMDCNGFKSFNIGGEVVFDSTMIRSPEKKQIKGTFTLSAASWDDFLMSINFNYPFEINKAPGYIFTVTNATIDMSESRNPGAFPGSYIGDTPDLNTAPETWKGFHITGINLQFPKKFTGQNTSPSVNLSNLIIDKEGVSVSVSVNNLISIENGNASGWAFSIDQFGLRLLHNIPVEGSMAGKIKLPVMDDPLRYSGIIDTQGRYLLTVSTTDSIKFDLWKASTVTLSQSSISLVYANNQFTASANLTGNMTIGAKLSEDANGQVAIPKVAFENLILQTRSPYLSVKSFGFYEGKGIEFKIAGFKTNINDIRVVTDTTNGEDRAGIGFQVRVTMTNIAKAEFGANGDLTVFGKRSTDNQGRHRWVYDDIQLNKLGIDVKNEVFAFKGDLELFKNKPTYGSGFRADLTLELKKGFKFSVQAMALFGTAKDSNGQDYSYWQVDALTKFNPGIVVGTVTLNGFGGGVYERMRQDAASTSSGLGMSLSGINYVPDVTMGLGIRASVTCSFGSESLVSAKVGLEFAFRAEGGLKYISFDGEATVFPSKGLIGDLADLQENLGDALNSISAKNKVMDALVQSTGLENIAGIQLLPKNSTTKMPGIITAKLHIEYLFDESTFHADLKININVFSILTGGGLAQMHFAPDKWYVRIGEPNNRMGVSLNLVVFNINVGSYFMVGHEIPAAPAPPAELARILNVSQKELNYMRNENELKSGKGIAFGLDINTKFDANFLMFYANFTAGMGFDIMLKKYDNVRCEGQTANIGINGWYANGQIYAYMSGSVGIKIKIFKIRKDINILSLGAASLLQAKFPNPFWMRGMVGGYYSVLNGKIKGRCNFKFELGVDCKKVQTDPDNSYALEDVEVIGDITPIHGTDQINIASPIKASFLSQINTSIDVTDDQGNTEYFRIAFKAEESQVTVVSTNAVIPGRWQLSSDARSAAFISDQLLPVGKEIKAKLVVGFLTGNGQPLKKDDGTPAIEVKTAVFKTDTSEVKTIPLDNIAYSYPLIKQANYYPGESSKGFIKLLKKQDQLFPNQNNKAEIVNGSTRIPVSSLAYNEGLITFDMPSSLVANTAYELEIKSETGSKIVSYPFRTSYYNTLKEKMEETFPRSALSTRADSIALNNPQEPFDAYELNASPGIPLLIEMKANLQTNAWYNSYIKPFYETELFQEWLNAKYQIYRDVPKEGILFTQVPNGYVWDGRELPSSKITLRYRVSACLKWNYDMAMQTGRDYCSQHQSRCSSLIFTPQTAGYCEINYQYILPNGALGASSGAIGMLYQK